jgi:hypothetical protein
MFLYPDDNLNIPSLNIRQFISLSIKVHNMFIRCTSLNIDIQFLLPIKYFLALTLLTDIPCFDSLAFPSTVLTRLLHMLVHPRT